MSEPPAPNQSQSRVPQILGSYVTCLVIAYVAVILRLISRRIKHQPLKTDDWVLVTSLIFTTGFMALNASMTSDGLGRHEEYIKNFKFFTLGILAGEVLYSLSIFLVKISILFLLHRIFPGRRFKYWLLAIASLIISYTLTQIVCAIVHCLPIRKLWQPTVPGRCIKLDDVILVCSSFNIATDVAMCCLPVPQLWKLKIKMRQRLELTFIFFLAALVCIFSIIRITKVSEISLKDPGWTASASAMWSGVECCMATLCACLPTMRPIYGYIFRDSKTKNLSNSASERRGRNTYPHPLTGRQDLDLPDESKDSAWSANRGRSGSNTKDYAGMEIDMVPLHLKEGTW